MNKEDTNTGDETPASLLQLQAVFEGFTDTFGHSVVAVCIWIKCYCIDKRHILFITFTLPSSLYVATMSTGMGKMPSVISSCFLILMTSLLHWIDRNKHPE